MKKKLLSLLLVLVMAATLLPTGAFALQVELPPYLEPWRPVYTIDNTDPNTGDTGYYKITPSYNSSQGSVYVSSTRADYDEMVTVQVYPANGYKINTIFVQDGNGVRNFNGASAFQFKCYGDTMIEVSFIEVGTGMYELGYVDYPDNTVRVSFTDYRGYAISSANEGDIVNMTVNTMSGYKIKSVAYNNSLGYITGGYYSYDSTQFTYQFTMEARDTYFTINTEATGAYSISVSNANSYYGSVSIKNGIEKANYGDTVTFTVRPAYQYILKSVSVYTNDSYRQSIQVTRDKYDWNTFSFTMPNASVVIAPTYTSDYYTISVDGGSHGLHRGRARRHQQLLRHQERVRLHRRHPEYRLQGQVRHRRGQVQRQHQGLREQHRQPLLLHDARQQRHRERGVHPACHVQPLHRREEHRLVL